MYSRYDYLLFVYFLILPDMSVYLINHGTLEPKGSRTAFLQVDWDLESTNSTCGIAQCRIVRCVHFCGYSSPFVCTLA